jgi:GxxExxY protein
VKFIRQQPFRVIRSVRVFRDSERIGADWQETVRFEDVDSAYCLGMSTILRHGDITEKIIGCAFQVHRTLGSGFQEVIYQRAMACEMSQSGLVFAREVEQNIFYRDAVEPIGTRRADFVVAGKVLVELKAVTVLEHVHWAQLLNYLRAYRLEVGLLLNFGSMNMTFKRLVL